MKVKIENGIAGKVCGGCRTWKQLSDFPHDRTKGSSEGFRHCRCKACHARARMEQRLKFRIMKERAIELGMWDSINTRAEMEAKRCPGIGNETLRL